MPLLQRLRALHCRRDPDQSAWVCAAALDPQLPAAKEKHLLMCADMQMRMTARGCHRIPGCSARGHVENTQRGTAAPPQKQPNHTFDTAA